MLPQSSSRPQGSRPASVSSSTHEASLMLPSIDRHAPRSTTDRCRDICAMIARLPRSCLVSSIVGRAGAVVHVGRHQSRRLDLCVYPAPPDSTWVRRAVTSSTMDRSGTPPSIGGAQSSLLPADVRMVSGTAPESRRGGWTDEEGNSATERQRDRSPSRLGAHQAAVAERQDGQGAGLDARARPTEPARRAAQWQGHSREHATHRPPNGKQRRLAHSGGPRDGQGR
ncbi:hypothetical protein CC85DRAFT_80858 [Cutaneotrichosporon oleaginosum]|uniref:Uncharacterized protein n=1 Tax=Cutaneotrichosporon oleaginosum TaxID=879819 RepID=A0A0J0XNH6_9TREE|nr:uncharacterized protein CC85DRAFT_80858 [Cutaneotrichosporon oleaginosum]KLT42633.1 hypothetical protein CC85DRAFT_80858 [Cutaneotrichosporon oleaginosum]TXT05250.1 hypothetical protein COLE_06570 [Cutaneotrichosporon oleaginosum]